MYFLFQLYSSVLVDSLYIFYLFVEILMVFIHFYPKFCDHIYDDYLELLIEYIKIFPFYLVLFLKFCLGLSFGTYSSVSTFCLILCDYFLYLVGKLHLSTLEKWSYVVDVLWDPEAYPPWPPEPDV